MAEQEDDIWDGSIAPWDRKRKATTITIPDKRRLPESYRIEHDHGPVLRDGRALYCVLVSFPNPSYRPQGETNRWRS